MALLFLLWQVLKKPSDLPPGRWGLPLVGWVPLSFKKSLEEHLQDLHKQHGNIYTWRMGSQVIVFLHDYKMLRDAFASTDFVDRPNWQLFTMNEVPVKGLVGSNGLVWHNNRRFALRQLRDLGMGKSKLVAAVHTQAEMLIEEFRKQAGRADKVPHATKVAVVNIVWQMIGSIQFKVTDERFKRFQRLIDGVFESMRRMAILDLFPWINSVFPDALVTWICRRDVVKITLDSFSAYFEEVIDEHKATLDKDNPRDLIDAYIIEMEKDNPDSTCSKRDLVLLIFDLFNAGTQTTDNMLTWMIFYLANHPKVQERMLREIDEVLPRGTLPILEDKPRLPYTEAVVHESLRKASLVSLGAQHIATRDTQLGGYSIPKGTIITGSFFAMHDDPRYWDSPEEFRPERWLNAEGKFVAKKEGFMPFGSGKRQCVGEGLARMELFIFSVALVQNFSFAPPPGKKIDLRPVAFNPILHEPKGSEKVVVTVRP